MSPLNEEQLHQLRDERTEQIMAAAVKVFARRGLGKTKMSMIAAEAGISHGLLYHYFNSKDDLFHLLVQWALEASVKSVGSVYTLPGSPLEKMRALTAIILEEENTPFFLLIYQARTSDEVPEKTKQLLEQYSMQLFVDSLTPLFVEGQQLGEIVEGDPANLIMWYFAMISGLMTVSDLYQIPNADFLLRTITTR